MSECPDLETAAGAVFDSFDIPRQLEFGGVGSVALDVRDLERAVSELGKGEEHG